MSGDRPGRDRPGPDRAGQNGSGDDRSGDDQPEDGRSPARGPLDRLGLDEEAKLFARMAAFGLIVGAGYGLLTGEPAGIVLLIAFGLASAVAMIAVVAGSRRGDRRPSPAASATTAAGASGPEPGWAPLEIGLGLGGLALGAAFGPWLAIAGLLVALIGAKGWLDATSGEAAAAGRGRPDPTDASDRDMERT
jgi:hypothetical protein